MPDERAVPAVRIVLADDHALVLDGLRAVLAGEPDLHVIATATDGERTLDAVRRLRPDVLVMDLHMPYGSGLDCLQTIRSERMEVRVLILSAFGDAHSLRAAVEAGADGFVLKTESPRATVNAIRQVAAGQLVFPQAARRWLAPTFKSSDPTALTAREEEVLALVAAGRSNAEISTTLNLSESTVKFHLRNLFGKLGVANRTEAAMKYHTRR
ncbi:MAG TPA: response regulator transcription factor [Gemmatimonadaceae bacterium]|nr:response regulator transcription factor [Gemmatimonadaceae bacterium]